MKERRRTVEGSSGVWEAEIRDFVRSGNLDAAATRFLERFGGEILGFLVARLRSETAASDVFSQFTEDLWRGLPGFQWRSTVRSWGYTLARNAANRSRRSRAGKETPLTRSSRLRDPARRPRSSTAVYLRTNARNRMRALRERLPADDQALLVLRIDKRLSWDELAGVLSGRGEKLRPAERVRWAARLRQRFVAVKKRLRSLAEAEGLV